MWPIVARATTAQGGGALTMVFSGAVRLTLRNRGRFGDQFSNYGNEEIW